MKALIAAVFVLAAVFAARAHAQPLPVPKPIGPGGSCPFGYTSSGSYCVPMQGAQDAIPKPPNGTCPWAGLCWSAARARRGRASKRASPGAA